MAPSPWPAAVSVAGTVGVEEPEVTIDRRALRRVLLDAEPWLADTDRGPQAVSAGACDRCRVRPRLLPTCGPGAYEALCRDCAEVEGDDAWCDGHLAEGRAARAWAGGLPARWGDVVVLWWVATGEVRPGEVALAAAGELPATVRALLPPDQDVDGA